MRRYGIVGGLLAALGGFDALLFSLLFFGFFTSGILLIVYDPFNGSKWRAGENTKLRWIWLPQRRYPSPRRRRSSSRAAASKLEENV